MRSEFFTSTPPMVLWKWLSDKIGLVYSTDFRALARVIDGRIIGVVGYNRFNGTSCEMHMAGEPNWLNREFLRMAFKYPFVTLGFKMVFGSVPSGNTRALKMDLKLGFHEILYIPGAHPDGGLHLLQMRSDQCRWIEAHDHGKEARSAAA